VSGGGIGSVLVVDDHPIFCRGLVTCITALDGVERVAAATTVEEARELLPTVLPDLVLLDHDLDGAEAFVAEHGGAGDTRVVVCSDADDEALVQGSIAAGASGFLVKRTLRPDVLGVALAAAASGNAVLAHPVLASLGRRPPVEGCASAPAFPEASPESTEVASPLTEREHDVLSLIANGEPTREVARQLSYSERTVKNVLHDVAMKLGARSRSHAVADAVRRGLI